MAFAVFETEQARDEARITHDYTLLTQNEMQLDNPQTATIFDKQANKSVSHGRATERSKRVFISQVIWLLVLLAPTQAPTI